MERYINTSLIKRGINPVDNNPEVYASIRRKWIRESYTLGETKPVYSPKQRTYLPCGAFLFLRSVNVLLTRGKRFIKGGLYGVL